MSSWCIEKEPSGASFRLSVAMPGLGEQTFARGLSREQASGVERVITMMEARARREKTAEIQRALGFSLEDD